MIDRFSNRGIEFGFSSNDEELQKLKISKCCDYTWDVGIDAMRFKKIGRIKRKIALDEGHVEESTRKAQLKVLVEKVINPLPSHKKQTKSEIDFMIVRTKGENLGV
ncbi:hypothetical protein A2982_01790 [candidate division WWE3 bacterium RIFCSPLOWO2_01_FULL_39_13]|uniref:Uncharacterized protein n=1 Tax=candidate division WWE3 bacterium RIFCSPLOWO2_01_FULL_39_13 TaxID=1802624 RepID=A0A1F4V4T8_UNCKA|nr:MAG: hypothetical protein A2982_01790 [candidate division WWE3 bacterium RIFCSPLOWO2_01_FULL_39_13]